MITVHRVTADDWARLRDVRLAALADSPDAFGSTLACEAGYGEATWRSRTESAASFLALESGQPVGLAAGRFDPQACAPHERLLVSLWVAPQARGRGVATRLIEAVASWSRADGASVLRLEVGAANHVARRVYERAGFVATGERAPMPRDPSIVEEAMIRRL